MFRPKDEEELWSLVTEERWAGYQQGGKSIRCCNNSCYFSVFHCQRAEQCRRLGQLLISDAEPAMYVCGIGSGVKT